MKGRKFEKIGKNEGVIFLSLIRIGVMKKSYCDKGVIELEVFDKV